MSLGLCLFIKTYVADFGVDVGKKQIYGHSTLSLKFLDSATRVILDTRGLKIVDVEVSGHHTIPSSKLEWKLGELHPVLGSALVIPLPSRCEQGDTLCLGISFEVDESSSAVQFLDPQQTAGKHYAFMFSQCQAIHARSLVPCQVLQSPEYDFIRKFGIERQMG